MRLSIVPWLICIAVVAEAQLDLSSPEATLAGYIESIRQGDVEGVLARYHNTKEFYLPGPMSIENYEIVKKIIFRTKEVQEWNEQEIIPAAKAGDVQLDVREHRAGYSQMYS